MKSVLALLGSFATVWLVACGIVGGNAPPTVIIGAPANAAQYQIGQDVAVQSTANDSEGIVRVELFVDGQSVKSDPTPNGKPQVQFTTIQVWKATTPGAHLIVVRATNARGTSGEAAVNVQIIGESASFFPSATPTFSAGVINTVTPIPTATDVPPNPTLPSGCTLNSAFVADVSVPDGTIVNPGATFVKTWRVLNPPGACAWESGFTLVLIGGEAMGAPGSSPVPPTAAGANVDLSVSMTAPTGAGTHSAQFRLRAGNGAFFGTNLVVIINVPGPPPPPTSTPQPTATNAPPQPGPTKTPTATPAPPNAATGFNATVTGQTTASTNWADNATNEDGFRVYRSIPGNDVLVGSRGALAGTGNTTLNLSGLVCSETYDLYVRSYKGAVESSASNLDTITTDPCTPSGVIAAPHTGQTVTVNWTDNSTSPEESGFKIYFGNTLKKQVFGSQDGTGARSSVVSGLDCGTTYTDIRVTSYYGVRESPKSSTAGIETTTACQVKIEFTRVDILNDTDTDFQGFPPTLDPGEIRLTFTVEGEQKCYPSCSGNTDILTGGSKTFSYLFTKNLNRTDTLNFSIKAQDLEDDPDDMGTQSWAYTGTFSPGPHTLTNSYFRIYYTITVTVPP